MGGFELLLCIFFPFFPQDEDSDDYDDGAALSLRGVSPPESVLSDEELLVDHVEDFNGQLKSAETEGAAAVPQK